MYILSRIIFIGDRQDEEQQKALILVNTLQQSKYDKEAGNTDIDMNSESRSKQINVQQDDTVKSVEGNEITNVTFFDNDKQNESKEEGIQFGKLQNYAISGLGSKQFRMHSGSVDKYEDKENHIVEDSNENIDGNFLTL